MNNSKKNIHNSGPLGMLVKNGQISKIIPEDETSNTLTNTATLDKKKASSSYFKTKSGIEFKDHELIFVDPKDCTPWFYANRLEDEMGNIDELIESIKVSSQLQPAVVRTHPDLSSCFKYEIIFGRRRHEACLRLGIPFLVIKKDFISDQDAITLQDSENKYRQNVSNYSNAILYKKLLVDGVFHTDKQLAEKLKISPSTFSELMAYTKIPAEIINKIPNIHLLSTSLALKIAALCKSEDLVKCVFELAAEIGTTISSPVKLEKAIEKKLSVIKVAPLVSKNIVKSSSGKRLFTFKTNSKGIQCIEFSKELANNINYDELCHLVKEYVER